MNISKINLKGTSYDIKDKLVRDSIGVASSNTSLGIAPLDASGKVPSENLPSIPQLPDSYNGHEYVDLGLPSGRLWAKCNIGASSETDYGLYFALGSNVGYAGDAGHNFAAGQQTPYYVKRDEEDRCEIYSRYVDGETLTFGDDTARNNWGGNWRMPTKEDFQELYDYCDANGSIEWTTINGINGTKFTSPNGNYVFFPAAGYCSNSSRHALVSDGKYWSSTCSSSDGPGDYTYYLCFDSSYMGPNDTDYRFIGCSVRAVQ